ncbi:hypothetical protein LDL08_38275 [Nonomuraea glycinis]|uniref:amidase family protein n=1 Tax=Nonomuraea glycinis TaxID=2047744 RepID=UPI001667C27E|nr:amidase family protein [Nonomuraea glycinis]MCA2182026.1 hypothetical protein [Nonomuraea glycinis]
MPARPFGSRTSALQQARRLEREPPDGPLAGVPIPVKDLNLVRDVPIMFGSATYRDFVSLVSVSAQVEAARGGFWGERRPSLW